MKIIPSINSATAALAIVAWTGALLAVALVLEFAFDQEPCPLCLMQRIYVMVAGLIAMAALAHDPKLRAYPIGVLLASVLGGAVSVRQMYLQLNPEAAETCGLGIDALIEYRPVTEVLRVMTLGTGDCAEPSVIPALAFVGFIITVSLALLQLRSR